MRTIEVEGSSKILAKPDSMEISLDLIYEDESYTNALNSLRKDHLALIRNFNEIGFESARLKTTALEINVLSAYDDKPKRFRLAQKFVYRDYVNMDKLSLLLDKIDIKDYMNFSINYYSSKIESQVEEALILALKDARHKASVLAAEADCKVHELISIKENDEHMPSMLRTMQADFVSSTPDDISLNKRITTKWSIK